MGLENMDPNRVFDMIKRLVGDGPARFMGRWAVYLGFAGFAAWMISLIRTHVIDPSYRLAVELLGLQITVDNIESIFATLILSVFAFAVLATGAQFFVLRHMRRRRVPQAVIDELAEFRSQGITILNTRPDSDAALSSWTVDWGAWADKVSDYLGEWFTKAEQLSFKRLGVIKEMTFGSGSYNAEHAYKLNQLSKQLSILENLVELHLERR